MDAKFSNGPLHDQRLPVDIGFAVIDVCEPVDGSQAVLFTMVEPNNGIWRYELTGTSEVWEFNEEMGFNDLVDSWYNYVGTKYDVSVSGLLPPEVWTKVGELVFFNPGPGVASVRINGALMEFSNGFRVKPFTTEG